MSSTVSTLITLMLEAQSKRIVFPYEEVPIPNLWDEIRSQLEGNQLCTLNVPNIHGIVTENGRSNKLLYPLHAALCLKYMPPPSDIVKMIINRFPDVLSKTTAIGLTPLHLAVKNLIDLDIIFFVLTKYPNAAKALTVNKYLPLHLVKNAKLTHMLLSAYPTGIFSQDVYGNVPLQLAISDNQVSSEVVQILLEEGFKHDNGKEWAGGALIKNQNGMNALKITFDIVRGFASRDEKGDVTDLIWEKFALCLLAISNRLGYKSGTVLHVALSVLEEDYVAMFALNQCRSEVNVLDSLNRFPLCIAAMNRNISKDVIRMLVEISPNAALHFDDEKRLPLHYTILNEREYNNGIQDIIAVAPNALTIADSKTGLYPFLLSAAHKGSTNTIYQLLREEPSVLNYVSVDSKTKNRNVVMEGLSRIGQWILS